MVLNLGVPRTASRYVALTLYPNAGHGHYQISNGVCVDLTTGRRVETAGIFVVGFVRNPFDLLVSHYRILAHPDFAEHPDADLAELPFGGYVAAVAERTEVGPGVFPRPGRLFSQLYDRDRLAVDYLGRWETLEADLQRVASITGATYTPGPAVNAAPRLSGWQDYYDGPTTQLVDHRWGEDLRQFGYSFAGMTRPTVTFGEQT